jgi:uncharacterized protein (DUF983 family)
MDESNDTPEILDGSGRPARREADAECPKCGAGAERRVPSAGFGEPHPVCGRCGFEFHGERC